MKKQTILWVLFLYLGFSIGYTKAAEKPPHFRQLATGAATVNELSNGILLALQSNNFEELINFLPTDADLAVLKKRGSEDMKALLETATADDIRATLKTEYEALVQKGVGNTLNWSEMTLAESQPGKGSPKNRLLRPVTLTLNTKQNQPVQVLYEALKVNNRYYLFRRMQLKS